MARNVEIKAKVPDLSLLKARRVKLNGHDTHELRQTDTFFHAPRGRLKLREFGDGTAELISYHRADQSDPKLSDYQRVTSANQLYAEEFAGAFPILFSQLGGSPSAPFILDKDPNHDNAGRCPGSPTAPSRPH